MQADDTDHIFVRDIMTVGEACTRWLIKRGIHETWTVAIKRQTRSYMQKRRNQLKDDEDDETLD